jgi:hypothetical protein
MVPEGGSWVWTAGWILWMGFFVLWEGAALATKKKGGTFSEHVWDWIMVRDPRPTKTSWLIRISILIGLLWLGPHLLLGWFTPSDPWPGG